jgi:Tol biopolymer transport system component
MTGKTVSHYRVLEKLGGGGMGVVYRAEDVRLGRDVALKFLPEGFADRQALERFQREARAASALNHPNICTIHDIDEHEGQPFIVMEFLDGETLKQRLATRRLDTERLLDAGIQIAEGLEAAHAKGFIHRDIKPANIFVTHRDQVKILDFGLAKLTAERKREAEADRAATLSTVTAPEELLTSPGVAVGTAAYMSPEQVRGEELDGRSDIFSLGAVLYEMATGTLPFRGTTSGVIFDGILNKQPLPPTHLNPDIPAEVGRIINKALEKDADLRYQSARELRADLARLRRDTESGRSAAAGVPVAALRRARTVRRWMMAGGVVSAVLLLAIASYIWSRPESSAEAAPRTLTRVTFDAGLQAEPTWSPDGRFIAYSSDQGGNFDVWVQPLGGGRPVQVTTHPAHDWQPAWSPDGNSLAFRSERDGGGIFVVPALGGRERQLTAFGFRPEWSPDGSRILFIITSTWEDVSREVPHVYVAGLDGSPPRRILVEILNDFLNVVSIGWHPDGERVSFWGVKTQGDRRFWTVRLSGGAPTHSERDEEVENRINEAGVQLEFGRFKWAPAGDALYFEGLSKQLRNLWKVEVDPQTLRWIGGPERLTTGFGRDSDVSLSVNGRKLAYATRTETVRIWSLPFDARAGRVTAAGEAVTTPHVTTMGFDLSPDGAKLVFGARRPGKEKHELWQKSLDAGKEILLGEADDYFAPRWSPDGARIAYRRLRRTTQREFRLAWMASGGGEEHVMPEGPRNPGDWSKDGEWLLTNCPPPQKYAALCASSITGRNGAPPRTILVDSDYHIWGGRFSPDGRWICFSAQSQIEPGVSVIGIVPASGGTWSRISDPRLWADKPRWAPDGRAIYFLSNRGGPFFDVWGVRLDLMSGTTIGEPFRVTHYDSPSRMIAASGWTEIALSEKRLVVPIKEVSGSIWLLDNVDR